MAATPKSSNEKSRITTDEVLESLLLTRVIAVLNTTRAAGESHQVVGYLRGFSDNWIIIQEQSGKETKKAEDLTIIYTSSILTLKAAISIDKGNF
jgi:hypothetical protein